MSYRDHSYNEHVIPGKKTSARTRAAIIVAIALVTASLLLARRSRTASWFSWRVARPVVVTISTDPDSGADELTASSPRTNPNGVLYWTCPMHPGVKEAQAGKHDPAHCGMELVPVYAKDR